ncbi:MAG: tetratricopeptide repeat protein [Chloroflexi bacterium]|nr:tetratricopeptide repeat protein [Chloroflexota bacterium]
MKHRGYQNGTARGGARLLQPTPSPQQRVLTRGLEHHQAGRLADAEASYRQVLAAEPGNAAALHLLGALANQCGQPQAAIELISQAIRIEPLAASYHNNLGVAYQNLKQFAEAAGCYERALALQPDHVDALNNRGVVLQALGRLDEALASFERSLKQRPNSHETLNNIASLLTRLGRHDEAELRLRRSLKLKPDYPEALITLAGVLMVRGQHAEAEPVARRAAAVAPNDARAHDMLGSVLRWAGKVDEAILSYQRTLAFDPSMATYWLNLAGALQVAGRTPEATEAYRQSLGLDPNAPVTHSGLIFSLDLTPGAAEERRAERIRFNERFGQVWKQQPLAFANAREPERRLRIGYVSADFYHHSAATAFMPILRAHDRSQVQVYCYSGSTTFDAVNVEARTLADVWHDVAFLTDDRLEALIRADEIDILVDLSGHSAGNRLPVFARKPAPIQVTAWGYCTGTGLDAIDAFLIDRVVVPPEDDHRYAERIVPVPSTLCFTLPEDAPPVNALPALGRGHVTFGAFNRLPKVTPETRKVWAELLLAIPTARLLVKTGPQDSPSVRQQLVDDLVAHGVEPERIEMRGPTSRTEHLAAHHDVDLILDAFPHGGGVTSIEALMMGVPVITLLGRGVSGRLSASFLTTLGLAELVATTTEQYVAIAREVAARVPWLAEQRATLRDRVIASSIADAPAYTRAVEAAYRDLWRQWCGAQATA